MSAPDKECFCDSAKVKNKNTCEEEETSFRANLKTTTEISSYFCLSKFDLKDFSCEEKLPKNFSDLENLLNKILLSLEETENVFLNQAKAVMDRDLALVHWRLRLIRLYKVLKEKKQDFERIDQTVQCILKVSCHIEEILSKLERELPGPCLMRNAFKYSPARMSMYDKMMKMSISQRDMLQQIFNMVLSINEAIECNPLDPVEQFTKILSLHMEILKSIEERIGLVEDQLTLIKALKKFYSTTKKSLLCDCYS